MAASSSAAMLGALAAVQATAQFGAEFVDVVLKRDLVNIVPSFCSKTGGAHRGGAGRVEDRQARPQRPLDAAGDDVLQGPALGHPGGSGLEHGVGTAVTAEWSGPGTPATPIRRRIEAARRCIGGLRQALQRHAIKTV